MIFNQFYFIDVALHPLYHLLSLRSTPLLTLARSLKVDANLLRSFLTFNPQLFTVQTDNHQIENPIVSWSTPENPPKAVISTPQSIFFDCLGLGFQPQKPKCSPELLQFLWTSNPLVSLDQYDRIFSEWVQPLVRNPNRIVPNYTQFCRECELTEESEEEGSNSQKYYAMFERIRTYLRTIRHNQIVLGHSLPSAKSSPLRNLKNPQNVPLGKEYQSEFILPRNAYSKPREQVYQTLWRLFQSTEQLVCRPTSVLNVEDQLAREVAELLQVRRYYTESQLKQATVGFCDSFSLPRIPTPDLLFTQPITLPFSHHSCHRNSQQSPITIRWIDFKSGFLLPELSAYTSKYVEQAVRYSEVWGPGLLYWIDGFAPTMAKYLPSTVFQLAPQGKENTTNKVIKQTTRRYSSENVVSGRMRGGNERRM